MNSFDKFKSLFAPTFITSVLYFCGYLSSEYYSKILGIKINYDALEIIKWGADFFIYSAINFLSNFAKLIKPEMWKEWLMYKFIIVIFLDIIFLWYITTKKSECTGFFKKILQKKRIITFWSFMFCIVIGIFSIHYLTLFVGKTVIDYRVFFKLGNRHVIYSFFILLNILNIINTYKFNRKSIWGKYILIIPLLFLPALYGVYGRNYNFNYIDYMTSSEDMTSSEKITSYKSLLLESHNGKNYFLERKIETTKNGREYAFYEYKILKDEEFILTADRINFFNFIKDKYHENNN